MALDRQCQIRDNARARDEEAEARLMLDHTGQDRSERIRAWRAWCAKQLLATFTHWPADEAKRQHAVGLCIAELEIIARHLHERAWLFDAKRLAAIVTSCLHPIAEAQRAGKVGDFFPYFRASVRRYVGLNAEELQQQAKRTGSDGASALGDILAGVLGRLRAPSLVEDLAANKAEACKPTAAPKRARCKVDATPDLFSC